jgi:hypothetical protein
LRLRLPDGDVVAEQTYPFRVDGACRGLPLFKEPMDLKLLSTRSFPAGAVALIYGRI